MNWTGTYSTITHTIVAMLYISHKILVHTTFTYQFAGVVLSEWRATEYPKYSLF